MEVVEEVAPVLELIVGFNSGGDGRDGCNDGRDGGGVVGDGSRLGGEMVLETAVVGFSGYSAAEGG